MMHVRYRATGILRKCPWQVSPGQEGPALVNSAAPPPTVEDRSLEEEHTEVNTPAPTLTLAQAMERISQLELELDAIRPQMAIHPPLHDSTHDFYLKTNIRQEWQDLRKWVEIRRLQDLPPKFCKGALVTLKVLGTVQVGEVFRCSDLIALVGPELQGLGIPEYKDHRGHQARLGWLFNPKKTGLRTRDLTNHALVLFTVEFPSKYFMSDYNP